MPELTPTPTPLRFRVCIYILSTYRRGIFETPDIDGSEIWGGDLKAMIWDCP